MADVAEFLDAAEVGNLPRVQKMLADGDVRITDADVYGRTALLYAAEGGPHALPTLEWLLEEGGARITERDHQGNTVLLRAAFRGNFKTCQWLLEDGGADITEMNDAGLTVWTMLVLYFFGEHPGDDEDAELTTLLRVMVVRGAPPADFVAKLRRPEHARVVEEGARLRAALPAYLARRRALLDARCPLIPPLLVLVRGYDPEPTTTKEVWATGLGVAP
jgi:hypothetical protein